MIISTTRKLPDNVENRMAELFDVRLSTQTTAMPSKDLAKLMLTSDVIVPTISDKITREMIEATSSLKLIANYGSGFDHIDIDAAHDKGVIVTNTSGMAASDTADLAMALLLTVLRRTSEGATKIRTDQWQGWSPTGLLGQSVNGKRLGILGMGRIGQAFARRAHAFNLSIHYHNRTQLHAQIEKDHHATYWPSLDQMLANIDILSINCPHNPSTYHLLNARRLKLMQPTSYIINTARGEVLDENALTRMLRSNLLAGAGLDVLEPDTKINPRLRELSNVTLIPHMGSATIEGRQEMGEKVILNIQTLIDGHRPPNQILPGMY